MGWAVADRAGEVLPGERECALLPRCASVRAPGGLVPTGGAESRGSKSFGTLLDAPPKIYLANEETIVLNLCGYKKVQK